MGFLNSFALKQMAKEHYVALHKREGFGRPPQAEISAIADAAVALDTGSERKLISALDRFANVAGGKYPAIALGVFTICGLAGEFPQYAWASRTTTEWEMKRQGL